jgi:AcrR family transcriptional regulator
MARRRGVRGEGRARLIGAAAACYGRGGRGGMTINQLCAQANTSVGTVYHHFPGGLRDVEDALYLDTLASYQRGLVTELRCHRSAAAGVRSMVMFHLGWMAENVGYAQYLNYFNASWLASEHLDRLEAMNTEFAKEVEDWCAPHVAAGRVRRLPILLFGQIVLGPAQQYGNEIIARTDAKQAAEEVRRAGPILAEAAWRAVRGDES